MTDEVKLREQAKTGREAAQVVESERFRAAFVKIEQFLLSAITDSMTDERDTREDAYRQVRLLRKLKEVLTKEVITGDAAMKELLRVKDPPKMMRILNGRR